MTHVDEKNWALVQFDILVREIITSSFTKNTSVILISPWFLDYEMPTTWPSFASNFLNITETQRLGDIIKLLRKNGVTIKLVSDKVENFNWNEEKKRASREFLEQMNDAGAEIYYNDTNHGKLTSTTTHVLFGSANVTNRGTSVTTTLEKQQTNVGDLFVKDVELERYEEKIDWAENTVLPKSQRVTKF